MQSPGTKSAENEEVFMWQSNHSLESSQEVVQPNISCYHTRHAFLVITVPLLSSKNKA